MLALLIGGAVLLEPLRVPTEGVIAPRSLMLFGLLLLGADAFGGLAHDFGISRIAGYLLAGILLGPAVTGIVPAAVLEDLGLMKRLAVGLIGLLAGAALKVSDLRSRWRSVLAILSWQVALVLVALIAAVLIGQDWIPFAQGVSFVPLLLVAFLFASILTVNSPMVTLALLTETRADGPVARTTLGVVLVADVAVILIFTVALSLAQSTLGGAGGNVGLLFARLLGELSGSALAGTVVGGVAALYLFFVRRELVLFGVVLVFATAAAAEALHFELLLSLLVAGFLLENAAPVRAEPFVSALQSVVWPVFVVFFALAGAELPIASFVGLWPVVLGIVLVRIGAIYAGARLGARAAGAEEVVHRYAWTGLVSQAGVALSLATLVVDRFPALGLSLQAVTIGVIAVNEGIGPLLFRRGLERAGEIVLR